MLRYGVIGTGMMGLEHIFDINGLDGAAVTAFADPHPDSRLGARTAAPDAEEFSDHRSLLESGLCDAVVVATPNHTHRDILLDALATDLHVMVEKPLCISVEQCRQVVEAGRGRRAVTWVAHEYRYMAPIRRLIAEVRAGTIGNLRMLAMREHRFPFLAKVGDWNRFNRYTGGTLVEKCSHFFDLMNLITSSTPVSVMASGGQDVNHLEESYGGETPDILDNAYVIVEYPGGVRALLDICMFAEATRHQEEVVAVGDSGKLEAFVPDMTVRIGRRGLHFVGEVETIATPETEAAYMGHHHGASYHEHLAFRDACLGQKEVEVSLEDGMLAVAVGVAAQRSIAEKRPVMMEEVLGG